MRSVLRSLVPDTIVGRAVTILLVALALSHLLSMVWYRSYLSQQADLADERVAAERIAAVKQAVMTLPPEERETAAHSLSGRGLTAHWSAIPLVEEASARDDRLDMLERRLQQLVPGIDGNGLRVAYAAKGYGADHVLLVSTRLPDGSWINARATALSTLGRQDRHFIVPTTLMSIAILAVSLYLVRVCTAEFRSIAHAARRLGVDVTAPPLPVHGPEEVREAAMAFNEMQGRIRTLVTDRTQMLAAISHDLRSPITTIRLRAEFIDEGEERDRILAQLDEMEAMVSATLSFLRDDGGREETKVVDISALLATICDNLSDAGRPAYFQGPTGVTMRCRPIGLKRALANLIENAVNYGASATVILETLPGRLVISIDDEGRGIPDSELETVFNPFYRIEESRNRETGGFGLGLTVARSVIRGHGGDLVLENRASGGLRALITLPWVS
ncbi:ATP-binding protein [Skermanella stibiiresistens]|jgi:signal transduction histidine kinase|uniref:ATP-binding protein n=1 Tax=Skermanella stibiiresistens TaxID=913326 RepID=UPI000564AA6B|nr:ATP-binding protein [Skermanella stibiiresistens]